MGERNVVRHRLVINRRAPIKKETFTLTFPPKKKNGVFNDPNMDVFIIRDDGVDCGWSIQRLQRARPKIQTPKVYDANVPTTLSLCWPYVKHSPFLHKSLCHCRTDTASDTKNLAPTRGRRATLLPTLPCPLGTTSLKSSFWTPVGMRQL